MGGAGTMTPRLPDGAPWPGDGRLDPALAEAGAGRPLSLYVHVPFCRVRCGYCDFNTYTTGFGPGAEPGSYARTILGEADLARKALGEAGFGGSGSARGDEAGAGRVAGTVFFGGGTPTMLEPGELARILDGLRERLGVAEDAEITVEANPETVTAESLRALARAGFTRVSVGMQSAVPEVLATLDRLHRPERVPQVVGWAREAGLDVSVDLIYGTPGESLSDWRRSLEAAVAMRPDHVSAYALVVEEGTRMGAQVARGELPTPDPDDEAAKYEAADRLLGEAGYRWYEISNFACVAPGEEDAPATRLRHASRHNLAYWRDWDWWGLGPGAHSHVGRLRWWNVKHPRAHAGLVAQGRSPAAAGEVLDADTRELERVMLAVRTADGVQLGPGDDASAVPGLVADGLVEAGPAASGRIVLTLRGRLLADHVTRVITR
jgi:oxygen-independent coproporphyrinogen-3 oxidase